MLRPALVACIALLAAATAASAAPSQTIKSFCSESDCKDGRGSTSALIMDQAGTLYGTTSSGGARGYGVVFALTPNADRSDWAFSVLHDFCSRPQCRDGADPVGTLVLGADGSLYGVTRSGGHGVGAIYKLTLGNRHLWHQTVLYDFCALHNCSDGSVPRAGLTYRGATSGLPYDGASPLYGTALGGRHSDGVVYELSFVDGVPAYKTIRQFCRLRCGDGSVPYATVTFDAAGNLYGSTSMGGAHGTGVVFELSQRLNGTWREQILHHFCSAADCADGSSAQSAITLDAAGNLYGTTSGGGAHNKGVLYKLTPAGTETVLHDFCVDDTCTDGAYPTGDLFLNADGALFGATVQGGSHTLVRGGTVYRFDGAGHTVLYSFCGLVHCAGSGPRAAPVADAAGNLYGTTFSGGANDWGTVYKLAP